MADPVEDRESVPDHYTGLLDGVLQLVDAGVYAVDDRGTVVALNPTAESLLARPADELLGRNAHDALHRDGSGGSVPRPSCPMALARPTGRTSPEGSAWFERGDGTLLPVSWLLTPFRAGEGTTGALVVFHPRAAAETPSAETGTASTAMSDTERLALLAETTTRLTSTLDSDEALRRLAHIVAPRIADWVVVDLLAENEEARRAYVVHMEDGSLVTREDLCGPLPPVPADSPLPLSRALRGRASTVATPATYEGRPDSGIAIEQRRMFEATGMHSAVIAPIRGPREVLGALTLGRSEWPHPFTDDDLPLLEDIARRTGVALENARLFQQQRRVAETLQRHLLPRLPILPGLETTVRYLPAPDASQVGGDWYDMFELDDGSFAVVIGDVVGHDLNAAAGMAQLRNMLRAHAWTHHGGPAAIVRLLDDTVMHVAEVSMATAIFGTLRREPATGWELRWSNAGHPPPLLVDYEGRAEFLEEGHGILLGTGTSPDRAEDTVPLPPRSTLVLYTDGLVESPAQSLDDGMERLRRHAAALVHRPLDLFCDQLLNRVRPPANEDDVALLALRVPEQGTDEILIAGRGMEPGV
ncbi:SpoIIE family protein phosphatase [Actinacidiphila acidipaludis]|uniref:SpoIIE family protein phosphatase n=1 Tax=Actinacidiphila acidipaludis TaxID=2873382 RepID=A0ABS7QGG7_9ACTN|nr:SpoIIE family protein phosphatase [Streptomyces acidipaludis]MBY8882250.1 SpoIIE family protein phosphatase [Streptomyces acidipaludis]